MSLYITEILVLRLRYFAHFSHVVRSRAVGCGVLLSARLYALSGIEPTPHEDVSLANRRVIGPRVVNLLNIGIISFCVA
jgi:hypothetical protein